MTKELFWKSSIVSIGISVQKASNPVFTRPNRGCYAQKEECQTPISPVGIHVLLGADGLHNFVFTNLKSEQNSDI